MKPMDNYQVELLLLDQRIAEVGFCHLNSKLSLNELISAEVCSNQLDSVKPYILLPLKNVGMNSMKGF
jgi:hypothetical protein